MNPLEYISTSPSKTMGAWRAIGLTVLWFASGLLHAQVPEEVEQYIARGELHSAMEKVQELLKANPNNFPLLLQGGELNLSLGKYKKGITLLAQAAKIDPHDFRAPYQSGIAYLKQAQFALAEKTLGTALALNPHNRNIQALYFLAAIKNRTPSSQPKKLLKNYPLRTEYPDTYFIHAIWHYSQGEINMGDYFVAAMADIVPHKKMIWYQSWLSDSGWTVHPRTTDL